MKAKSHKRSNTFRFRSFSERLTSINVDVIHKLEQRRETPDNGETFFEETLDKWRDRNCTASFENFTADLAGVDCKTLAQLLHNKTIILECLQRHLEIPKGTAYDAFFELVVALARDLLGDFYPHFGSFFEIMVQQLKAKDSDLLEHVFTTVSYLFKYLWRHMVKDIDNVYRLYSPLFDDSNREYIIDFATESISFLLRKVRNKTHLLELIFSNLDENSSNAGGVGKLLCSVLQTVQHHFHSNAGDILTIILSKMGLGLATNRKSFTWSAMVDCVSRMIHSMMDYTTQALSSVIWDSFTRTLTDLKEAFLSAEMEAWPVVSDHLGRVLELLLVGVSYKRCSVVLYNKSLQEALLQILTLEILPDSCGRPLVQIVACLLLSPSIKMDIGSVKKFIHSVFDGPCSLELKLLFSQRMYQFGMFEKDVLPSMLHCCSTLLRESSTEKDDVLLVLTKMVLRFRPLLPDGEGFRSWKRFTIEFSSPGCSSRVRRVHNKPFMEYLEGLMKLQDSTDFNLTIPQLFCAVVCIPHTSQSHHSILVTHLTDLFKQLVLMCQEKDVYDGCLLLLAQTLESLQLVSQIGIIDEMFSLDDATELLINHPDNVHMLRLIYCYLNYLQLHGRSEGSSPEFLASIYPSLEPNLASPYHQIRLLTLKILVSFKYELPPSDTMTAGSEAAATRENVFEICLAAEKVSADLQGHRERIRLLTNLQANIVTRSMPVGGLYRRAPLYYLIGTLYVNFSPFWDPAVHLIVTHARALHPDDFWQVFGAFLRTAADQSANAVSKGVGSKLNFSTRPTHVVAENEDAETLDSIFLAQKERLENTTERVDHVNHRRYLWKVLLGVSDLAETRSDLLSDLLLEFVQREYHHVETIEASTQDLSRATEESTTKTDGDSDDEEEEDPEVDEVSMEDGTDADGTGEKEKKPFARVKVTVSATQSLCAHLSVFGRFHHPQSLSRESELKELYLRLLQNQISGVQRLALDCIATYKHAHLAPYKDNFYRILTPQSFRSEITRFGISAENGVVLAEHRAHVIPLLMRILYGKMAGKEPMNNKHGGRDGFLNKRNVIFQFVASSSETEMGDFLSLAFAPYVGPDDDEKLLPAVRRILANRDFTAFDPIKKLKGALFHLDIVFKNLGHHIRSVLPWLLRVLVVLIAKVVVLLENRDLIQPHLFEKLKQMRVQGLERITEFFQRFDTYPFSREEINAIFLVAVWPQLPRLPTEVLSAPNALLKMFASWSNNPRYFVLLAKRPPNQPTLSPVRVILELLSNDRVPNSVSNMVLVVATNLLTLDDHSRTVSGGGADFEGKPIDAKSELMELGSEPLDADDDVDNDDEVPSKKRRKDSSGVALNYGTTILLPYVSHLMARLKLIVSRTSGSAFGIAAKHLTVLTRLSEIVTDRNYCKELAALLLPFLNKNQNRTEESEVQILKVIINLVKLASTPKTFLSQLPVLFSTVINRQSRSLLCELLTVVAASQKGDKSFGDMIVQMNAWNVRRPDEPDYKIRLAAFQAANDFLDREESHLDQTLYLFLIYNCVFLINVGNDLSMRDSASHLLQHIAKKLGDMAGRDRQVVQQLMLRTLLPEVNKGIKVNTEEIRHEYVAILAKCVRHCPDLPICRDLHPLLNDNPEIDFFDSLKHVQMHRRAAGMKRLAERESIGKIKQEVLVTYILPQAQLVIYHEKYGTQKPLVNAAVQLIGSICKVLNWTNYERQLKYFIERLSKSTALHQSRSVKALTAVLDAFHFNLTKSTLCDDKLVAPPTDIKAERFRVKLEKNDEAVGEGTEEQSMKNVTFPPLEPAEATKIHTSITKSILPQLQKHLSQKVHNYSDTVAETATRDNEVLRVPMAIAMVKLLLNLPKSQLDKNLPSILLKICAFLKSRMESVRTTARETLVTIMRSLGPEYLPFLIHEIGNVLVRGYQIHVKIFSIHAVLLALSNQLQPGDLDSCLPNLLALCQEEMFGKLAEEKEVRELVSKCVESKTKQAFNIYEILAKFVTEGQLKSLVSLLQERLNSTVDHSEVTKIEECFKRISVGLSANKSISFRNLMVFSYLIFSEAVAVLEEKKIKIEPVTTPSHLIRPDTFLIQKEPGRTKALAPTYARTNAHVSAAFAATLLRMSLKAGQINMNEKEHLEMLDPFVPKLALTLSSPSAPLLLASVQCLNVLLRSRLPSVQEHVSDIATAAFALLKKYSQSGTKSADVVQLVHHCFKMVTVLISQVPNYRLDTSDIRIILVYVEQGMMDATKHATAFTMLKSILTRKLILPEIRDIMTKVIELSINCSTDHIRIQCRLCAFKYLTDYPLGMEVMTHLNFYLRQLEFSEEYGRESALEMLTTVFDTFPPALITENAAYFFVPISTRLINDSAERLRKMTALALALFLRRISAEEKDNMFMIVETWMKDTLITHRRLASTLCGIFAEAEKEAFQGRVVTALPLLLSQLEPSDSDKLDTIKDQNVADHVIVQALTSLMKIISTCEVVRHIRYRQTCRALWDRLFQLMHHSHMWVQLRSVQLAGLMLDAYEVEEFPALIHKKAARDKTPDYILENFPNRLGQFFFKFAWQGTNAHQVTGLEEQLLANLVYISRILCRVSDDLLIVEKNNQDYRTTTAVDRMVAKEETKEPSVQKGDDDAATDDEATPDSKPTTIVVNFGYLARTLKVHAEREVCKMRSPTTNRRTIYCKWILKIVDEVPKKMVIEHLTVLLVPLVRELMSTNKNEALTALTNETVDKLRSIVGVAIFSQHYSTAQTLIAEKRMKRKQKKAVMAVVDPETRAKEKIKNHLGRTSNLKRRRAELLFRGQGDKLKRAKVKRDPVDT